MDEKRFRLDFVIAFCALLISTVAATATVYQTHVIARQFSATVWPYISFEENNSPWSLEIDLRNDGLGPAIIRSVEIQFYGKRQSSIEALLGRLAALNPQAIRIARAALRAGAKLTITTSTPSAGMVIPANTRHVMIRMDGAVWVRYFQPAMKHIALSLCYCSLTGNCWTQSFPSLDAVPRTVAACART